MTGQFTLNSFASYFNVFSFLLRCHATWKFRNFRGNAAVFRAQLVYAGAVSGALYPGLNPVANKETAACLANSGNES